MEDFFDLPTLVVIAVAVVILFRLRQVLGTRTGNERPRPLTRQEAPAERRTAAEDKVVPMRRPVEPPAEDAARRQRRLETEIEQFSRGDAAIAKGLREIAEADPAFTPKSFIEGAKGAYEWVVTAFAQADRKTLKMLLDKEVYDGFERALSEREAAGHTVDFTFVGLPRVDITEAELDKRNALVTIRFDAEVVSATRDKDGTLVEGHPEQVATIADEWTFARSPKSRDPNWKVIATNQVG